MRRPAVTALSIAVTAALAATAVAALPTSAAGASTVKYTVRTLHFAVKTGPNGATACDIIGDLYTPKSANSKHRWPAIRTSSGFGAPKADQAVIGKASASRGYEVLSYSGL